MGEADHDLIVQVARDVKWLVEAEKSTQDRLSRIESDKPNRREIWGTFAGLVGVSGLVSTLMMYMGG